MKNKILLLTIGLVFSLAVLAQEEKVDMKSMTRAEKKAYKEKVAVEQKAKILLSINAKQWVLEATSLQVKSGESFQLEPTLNFVGMSGENTTVQLGSSFMIGANGVGGITLDGKTRKYDINEGKKATSQVTVRMIISGSSSGNLDILLSVSPGGNANATITDMYGTRLTYRGRFKALHESKVFKGATTY